ncbi:PspC domain-containing protein [Planomonospora sp. ID67723]|uniref:PspC domain-containing protein n=1 Tax=Planomonospora sp. ID67723 TaxID=2738134 RepID=UPI0018C3BB83|nr:PspC domain-containing protein [Planomonospora sp. ID67723]MBG0827888.1 PspC domain-containing protein [Planomonospora sp. ID67723]
MTETGNAQDPASTPPDSPPTTAAGGPRRLGRSDTGRMLTGVCAGLGRYAGVDPVLFRVGFAMLVLASGVGVMLYIAAFLLMRETSGAPGHIEQWTRRDFDGETVMALLTGVFGFGLVINVSSGGIGTASVVVGTTFAVALLAAHSRGVDLVALARTLPERLRSGRHDGPKAARPEHRPGAFHPPAPPSGVPAPVPPVITGPHPGTRPPAGPYADPPAPAEPYPPAAAPAAGSVPAQDPAERTRIVEEAISAAHARMAAARARRNAETDAGTVPAAWERPREETRSAAPDPYAGVTASYDSSGEPFAPYGPYRPLDPRRGPAPQTPYDLAAYGARTPAPPRPRPPRSFIGTITIFLAMIVGGIIMAVQSASGSVNMTVVGSAALITIGGGLLVAAWFGRGAALVAAGTVVALTLVVGSALGDIPKKFGTYDWAPTSIAELAGSYTVGVGEGTLDLGELTFAPGSRTVVEASVSVGEITVILPPTVRVEVSGYAKLGDVKIDHSVQGGADIRHDKTLEPEITPEGEVATIVLTVKAGVGDVEVRRAA